MKPGTFRDGRLGLKLALLPAACLLPLADAGHSQPSGSTANILLGLHNRERRSIGVPELVWDEGLATSAASYGPELAKMGRLVHSPRDSRPGQRENLARIQTSQSTPERLVDLWIREKQHYRAGTFPNVSDTGSWYDVAHYTQMIWRDTRRLGCAIHREGGWDYLVCRYSPPGNADGKRPA